MHQLLLDVRYALRLMARKPALTALAVLSLALGIGVNTAIFTLVNAVILRDLPIAEAERVVEVYTSSSDDFPYATSSVPDYRDLRAQAHTFSGLAARQTLPLTWDDGERTELLMGELVSGNYFDVLGVKALVGRTFLAAEDRAGVPVAVLGHDFWQQRFAGDPAILGHTLKLNGRELEVIGVAPPSFKGSLPAFRMEVWAPLSLLDQMSSEPSLEERGRRSLFLTGRLAPGVTLDQTQAELGTLAARLAAEHPATNEGRTLTAVPVRDVVINPGLDGPVFGVAALLMVIVGLVLLIACSNIANLLLARASDRRKELALRLALGSGRARLIRQLLTESLLMALLGAAGGVLFALWATRLLVGLQPPFPIPLALDLGIDLEVLGFTVLLAVATGVVCGLAPALHASRPELVPALKDEIAALGRGYRRLGVRNLLIVGQVTVSTLLLIGAGLFIRSLQHASSVDPGFTLRRGVAVTVLPTLGGTYTEEETVALYRELRERAAALPGVRSVALANFLPLGLSLSNRGVYVEGQEPPAGEDPPEVDTMAVGQGYFATLGIPLVRGRDVADADGAEAPGVAIVNETMARRYWPGEDPLGKRLRFDDAPDAPFYEVIGVAQDGKYRTLGEAPRPYLYTAAAQSDPSMMTLIVAGDAEGELLAQLRLLLAQVAPRLPIFEIKTVSRHLEIMLFAPRMGAGLLAGMGLLGLVLAAVGLYGVVAYSVVQRTREIGVRLALGADRGAVLRLVVGEGMTLVAIGAALGIALGLIATRALTGWLYGISASDPVTYVAVPLCLTAVAWLANYLPARRALGIDPIQALRYQ